jgi:hypothetical protein
VRLRIPVTQSLLLATAAFLGGCQGHEPTAPPPPPGPPHLSAVVGDFQIGEPDQVLADPLVVQANDVKGHPAPGLRIRWQAELNGTLESADAVTGADGRAGARFRLGTTTGTAAASAELDETTGDAPVTFRLAAVPTSASLEPGGRLGLHFDTFEGSGQVVHPDYAATPGWHVPRHLAITPYPNGSSARELPSLFASWSAVDWIVPPGVPNPVEQAPVDGYLSDPDLVFVPEARELWLYYRAVTTRNLIYLVRTSDGGRHWTDPELVVTAPNHEIISPTVVRLASGDWWMWSVNGGPSGCNAKTTAVELRRSMDGHHWGPPETLALGAGALWPWHLDVQWIPSRQEFWALSNAKEAGNCATPALFLATSPDGRAWTTLPRPVLVKGDLPAFRDIVYRSTFEYRPADDDVILWYSGATFIGGSWTWSAMVERRSRSDLFAPAAAAAWTRRLAALPPAPPLRDWP